MHLVGGRSRDPGAVGISVLPEVIKMVSYKDVPGMFIF